MKNNKTEFLNLIAQFSNKTANDITNEMRFREDLGFSSLDFMAFLGELEDTFDIELDEDMATQITTVSDALNYLDELQQTA